MSIDEARKNLLRNIALLAKPGKSGRSYRDQLELHAQVESDIESLISVARAEQAAESLALIQGLNGKVGHA